MYAVAYDLVVSDTDALHPKGQRQAYVELSALLRRHGFERVQGSVFVIDTDDMAPLFMAMDELKQLAWFPDAVRDIRAFRVENWSDFTPFFKKRAS